MIDFETKQIIGCIPVWASPSPPPDQTDCVVWECKLCKQEMWVSHLKRDHYHKSNGTVEIYCAECIVKEAHEQGYEPEIVDISKVN